MAYSFGLLKHPVTNDVALVVQAQPQPWTGPDVLNLLRTIKKGFPDEFRQVHYEMVLPANGASSLVIPEDIAENTE